jgi:1-aminocyclopropane-1-carboxylate deaminase
VPRSRIGSPASLDRLTLESWTKAGLARLGRRRAAWTVWERRRGARQGTEVDHPRWKRSSTAIPKSGSRSSGNKTRKLEYLVAEAIAQSCDTLVSIGGVQSNHTRQVAAHVGTRCVLVQETRVDWPDPVYDKVGNILLSRILGADIRMVHEGFGIGFKASWEQALADVKAAGGKPYPIPAGASDHPLGGLGFARWAQEVEEQERDLGIFFDTVIVCSVTGSTPGGDDRRLRGPESTAPGHRHRRVSEARGNPRPDHAHRAADGRPDRHRPGLRSDEIVLDARYHAGTYGIADEQTVDAIKLCARTEGMITDPVYEGKSLAGMIEMITSKESEPSSTVLYAHLGGQPALNGYGALFA